MSTTKELQAVKEGLKPPSLIQSSCQTWARQETLWIPFVGKTVTFSNYSEQSQDSELECQNPQLRFLFPGPPLLSPPCPFTFRPDVLVTVPGVVG